MGQNDLALQGYPRSTLKSDYSYVFLCGGKGGGGGPFLQTQTFAKFSIDVNAFITRNRELDLSNDQVNIYTDSLGIHPTNWWLAISAVSTLNATQILAQNNQFINNENTIIQLFQAKLPQPTDAGWASKFWIYIYWGSTSLYGDFTYIDDVQWLAPKKHNFDERL